jgi:hypothetical protein
MKSQDLRGECLAHGVQHHDPQGDRSRPTPRLHNHHKKPCFEEETGQLKEWMTVVRNRLGVRDRLGLGQRVEYHLDTNYYYKSTRYF